MGSRALVVVAAGVAITGVLRFVVGIRRDVLWRGSPLHRHAQNNRRMMSMQYRSSSTMRENPINLAANQLEPIKDVGFGRPRKTAFVLHGRETLHGRGFINDAFSWKRDATRSRLLAVKR